MVKNCLSFAQLWCSRLCGVLLGVHEQYDRLGPYRTSFADRIYSFAGFCLYTDTLDIDSQGGRQILSHPVNMGAELWPFQIDNGVNIA